MSSCSNLRELVRQFEAMELHAARSGREVTRVLADIAVASPAASLSVLARELEAAVDAILAVLPAYAPALNAMHRVMCQVDKALAEGMAVSELQTVLAVEAQAFQAWCTEAQSKVARYAAQVIPAGANVYTFTLSETMQRALRAAWEGGKAFDLLVTESRPNYDGLVTAAALASIGVPVSVSIDAAMGEMIPKADLMLVGAEAIMADGSAICKVGTYPSALIAQTYGLPVFVVADTQKFNPTSLLGLPLPLDPLPRTDVLPAGLPAQTGVVGHLFDRTPPELIRGIITEKGILSPTACRVPMEEMPLSMSLATKLVAWAHRSY